MSVHPFPLIGIAARRSQGRDGKELALVAGLIAALAAQLTLGLWFWL